MGKKRGASLKDAVEAGDLALVKKLLAAGASPHERDRKLGLPLFDAAWHGRTAIVRALIEAGADVNDVGAYGNEAALQAAANKGHLEVVRALLAAGADVKHIDQNESTALSEAVYGRTATRLEIVRALIEAGADVNAGKNATVLMCASEYGSPEIVKTLLDAGAQVNAATGAGTALLAAVAGNLPDNVAVLLAAGADPSIPDEDGLTPLSWAREQRRKKIVALLEAAAAGTLPLARAKGPPTAPPAIAESWRRIHSALGIAAPEVRRDLRRGATEEVIARLEARCGVTLPEPFKESYRLHNGQKGDADCLIPAVFTEDEYELMDLGAVASEWKSWKSLVDIDEFAGRESDPDKGIQNCWWHAAWIPFATNGASDSLCLDLAPARGGKVGQVISMNHEVGRRQLLAPSFAHFLGELAEALDASPQL